MRRLTRLSEALAQFLLLTFLSGITFWSIYTAFEALRESPWWFVAVAFFILLGFAVLIYQGLELIARITDPPYPNAHHIDDPEDQSLTALDEEVDDWGSLHEIVEEYHNDVRFGGDGREGN